MTDEQRKKRNHNYKLVLAGAGSAAVVSMGVFGALLSQAPSSEAEPGGSVGETVTDSTAPTELETSVAKPEVTAEVPDGYGS
ncbi:hypothetical protein ACWDTP_14770 [Mycobacterium sp. NPDC003449]